ncbi:MAG: DoxX family protein [Chitinophagaceae bacterium]|nr:MAG: DoxX family protein [Chitinophagaceae bacterium]
MHIMLGEFYELDKKIIKLMATYGLPALRISMGVVFLWFGFLKFFPGVSPAEELAIHTTEILSFGLLDDRTAVFVIALWESIIGIGLIFRLFMRFTILLLFLQMIGACAPLVIFPDQVFTQFPYAPTLEGQYIIKNIVIICAALVLGASVRGGSVFPGFVQKKLLKKADEKSQDGNS